MNERPLREFFAERAAETADRQLGRIEFGLIHHLTRQREFPSVDALVRFCRDPQNLQGLLPDPRDRRLFSRRLVDALLEYRHLETDAATGVRPPR